MIGFMAKIESEIVRPSTIQAVVGHLERSTANSHHRTTLAVSTSKHHHHRCSSSKVVLFEEVSRLAGSTLAAAAGTCRGGDHPISTRPHFHAVVKPRRRNSFSGRSLSV